MSTSGTWAPGWFRDPTGRHDHRWWDGAEWTSHVADAGVAAIDPVGPPPPPSSARRTPGPVAHGTGRSGRGPRPATALLIAAVALPSALLPFLGLLAASLSLGIAIAAHRRTDALPRDRRTGVALVLSGLAVTLALITSVNTALLLVRDSEAVGEAMRTYAVCIETRPSSECRAELQLTLTTVLER